MGDKAAENECGRRAGTRTVLVLTGYGARQKCAADFVCGNVVEAAAVILALTSVCPDEERVRQETLEHLEADPERCLAEYTRQFGNILNTDNAATLFPAYN